MSESRRELVAIMFTDIVGYTTLMGGNEKKAFDILNKNRQVQKPLIEWYKGRWIKELGDGVMATFPTASDAVSAAIKIQETLRFSGDYDLRIGIHLGEVVLDREDVFGDGVNIASRIETLGKGGSILVSKSIRDQIKNNEEFQLISLGTFLFKNVEEPIEVFALSNPGFVVPQKDELHGKMARIQDKRKRWKKMLIPFVSLLILALALFISRNFLSNKDFVAGKARVLAILPFENPQNDTSLYYLSAGIPENLINRFSAIPHVKVFARAATFGLSDSLRTIPNLRNLLNADVVLTGQLQKRSNEIILNCQLIDAVSLNQIWGYKYELTSYDISRIEDSIITSLIHPLKIRLVNNSKTLQKDRNVDPAAYAEYLKGRHLSYGSTSGESEKALSHFRAAIQIDPKFAKGYAAIANEKIVQSLFSTASKTEIVNEARISLEAAKALDPDLAEIYTTEGALKFYYDWDWEGAVDSYKKALRLDPGNATIYIRYSSTLADVGRYKEALLLADKAVELDPVSISSLHNLGWTNLVASNFKKSTEAFEKALELHPNWVWGHIKKAYGHVYLGDFDKALVHAGRAEELFKDGWGSELLQVALTFIHHSCNNKEKADFLMNRFFKYASENTLEDPWTLSYIYYLKGDYSKAVDWEEKVEEGRYPLAYTMNLPIFYNKEYFESREHQRILREMGFVK